MARQHRCPQCGAPHRLLSAQSRFRCDYCSALVELREESQFEIWQIGVMRPARDAERCARRWLREQGIDRASVRVEGPDWAAVWQLNSREGEEFHRDSSRFVHPLLAQLPLPAGARVEADPRLPEPALPRAEVEAAALASFRDPEAAIESTRLLYQPLLRLSILLDAAELPALYLCASDQLLVAPIPEGARRLPADPVLLAAYLVFASLCLLLGASVDGWLARSFAMAFAFTLGTLAWRALARSRSLA